MSNADLYEGILRELESIRKELFELRKTFTLFSEAMTENLF